MGDKAVLPGIEEKLQKLRYGLTGNVPDGMLVRVSSINHDNTKAYQLQAAFVRDLLGMIKDNERVRLIGSLDI